MLDGPGEPADPVVGAGGAIQRQSRQVAADVAEERDGHRWRNRQRKVAVECPADQQPADAPVPVGERVDRLELGMEEAGGRDRIVRRLVRVVDEVDHQCIDAVVGRGDVRGPMWGWSTDPAEAVPPGPLEIVVEVGRRHQDAVPLPQVFTCQRTLMGQDRVKGAEVVRDLRSRPGHGRIHVGDGDRVGGSADRLDSAGSHPFGAQEQSSGDFEVGIVPGRRRAQDPLGASRIESSGGAEFTDIGERGRNERVDRAAFPLHGDDLVRHRIPSQRDELRKDNPRKLSKLPSWPDGSVGGRWARPPGARQEATMTSASQTSAAVTLVSMDQPTTRRDHESITAAKYSHPCPVWNWVTSAAHNRSGPFGLKLRPTRSGAGAVSRRPRRQRRRACTPTSWRERIKRATRLRPQRRPSPMSSVCTQGAP